MLFQIDIHRNINRLAHILNILWKRYSLLKLLQLKTLLPNAWNFNNIEGLMSGVF